MSDFLTHRMFASNVAFQLRTDDILATRYYRSGVGLFVVDTILLFLHSGVVRTDGEETIIDG